MKKWQHAKAGGWMAGALILLSACDTEPSPQPVDAGTDRPGLSNAQEAALANSTLPVPPDQQVAAGPGSGQEFGFVGRWAAEAALCPNSSWLFRRDSLQTPAGSQCSFSDVRPVAGGFDIAARCTAEGPPTDDVLRIRFARSARAMTFESDAIADAGLVYCGPLSDLD